MSKEANQSKRRYFPLRDASNPYKVNHHRNGGEAHEEVLFQFRR